MTKIGDNQFGLVNSLDFYSCSPSDDLELSITFEILRVSVS
jgi:hypothetical protein